MFCYCDWLILRENDLLKQQVSALTGQIQWYMWQVQSQHTNQSDFWKLHKMKSLSTSRSFLVLVPGSLLWRANFEVKSGCEMSTWYDPTARSCWDILQRNWHHGADSTSQPGVTHSCCNSWRKWPTYRYLNDISLRKAYRSTFCKALVCWVSSVMLHPLSTTFTFTRQNHPLR